MLKYRGKQTWDGEVGCKAAVHVLIKHRIYTDAVAVVCVAEFGLSVLLQALRAYLLAEMNLMIIM